MINKNDNIHVGLEKLAGDFVIKARKAAQALSKARAAGQPTAELKSAYDAAVSAAKGSKNPLMAHKRVIPFPDRPIPSGYGGGWRGLFKQVRARQAQPKWMLPKWKGKTGIGRAAERDIVRAALPSPSQMKAIRPDLGMGSRLAEGVRQKAKAQQIPSYLKSRAERRARLLSKKFKGTE